MGGKASSSSLSTTNIATDTKNTNTNISSSNVDNSQEITSNSNVVSNAVNTQTTTNVSNVDNSTNTNISSTSNTTNIDQSVTTTTTDNRNMTDNIMKCGFDAEGAKDLVANINESININNNASNTFIVTGNNNTISDVKLESMLQSYGPTVDKKCVQDAITKAASQQTATNTSSSSTSGTSTGTDLKTGGNVNENTSGTSGSNTSGVTGSSGASGTSENTTSASNEFVNTNPTENTTSALTEQTTKVSASGGQTGIGQASGSGLYEGLLFMVMLVISIMVLNYMERNGQNKHYSTLINIISSNQLTTMIIFSSLFYYVLNI
jgi:hypothetical protein